MNTLTILGILLTATILSVGQTVETEWFDQKWLDENYLFKWKTNHLEKEITIRVEVMAKGWVGFGLSKHGKTTETDVVIGWVDDWGHSTFNDYWVNELGNRSLDASQDWTLLSAEKNATHTILEFSRHYVTCDESNDLEIYENDLEQSNIIYSYGHLNLNGIETIGGPIVDKVFYLNLFEKTEPFDLKENDIEIIDNWMNLTLLPKKEDNHCLLKKYTFSEKQHIIKYQAITYPTNDEFRITHHFALFECQNIQHLNEHLGQIFKCYDPASSLYVIRKQCIYQKIESVLNNEPVQFPANVGITIDPVKNPFFILEGHLKNPSNQVMDVRLSLRIWFTKKSRSLESSTAVITSATGSFHSNWGFIVPPKQSNFKVNYILSTYCFENKKFDEQGIFIFKLVFHTHHGLSSELRHYRNDQLIMVLQQNYQDAFYQPFRTLKVAINLRKFDKLLGFCDYNSIAENKSYGNPHEHCAILVFYYPAIPVQDENTYNSRISYKTILKITGLEEIDGYETELSDNIIIRKPVKYNNTKLIDFISENKYKINDPKELEELQIRADMMECCYYADTLYAKKKPCRIITKPPGLYRSVMNTRKPNSCPNKQNLDENKLKANPQTENKWMRNGMKIFLSFKALIN